MYKNILIKIHTFCGVRRISYCILFLNLFLFTTILWGRSTYQEAKYSFSLGNWNKAYTLFTKSTQLEPQNGNPLFYMAYIREQQGNKDEAIPLYEKAVHLKLDKELKEKSYWKIILYYKETQNWKKSLVYSNEFLKFNQHASIKKIRDLSMQKYNPSKEDAEESYKNATEMIESGNSKEGAKLLEKVVLKNPDNLDAHWQLVLIKMENNHYADAFKHLKLLIENNENNWQYQYKAGVCLYRLNQYDQALGYLERAQKLFPEKQETFDFYTNYMLGEIYITQSKSKLAIEHLLRANNLRSMSGLKALLALSYWRNNQNSQAMEYAKKSITEEPKQNLGFLLLSLIEWENQNEEEAFKWAKYLYTNSLKNKINNSHMLPYHLAFLLLGEASKREENWQSCIKYYLKVNSSELSQILNDKDLVNFHNITRSFEYNFGMAYLNNNDPKNALSHFQIYIDREGEDSSTLYQIAYAYALLFNGEKAKIYLERAILKKEEIFQTAKKEGAFVKLSEQDQVFHDFLYPN